MLRRGFSVLRRNARALALVQIALVVLPLGWHLALRRPGISTRLVLEELGIVAVYVLGLLNVRWSDVLLRLVGGLTFLVIGFSITAIVAVPERFKGQGWSTAWFFAAAVYQFFSAMALAARVEEERHKRKMARAAAQPDA